MYQFIKFLAAKLNITAILSYFKTKPVTIDYGIKYTSPDLSSKPKEFMDKFRIDPTQTESNNGYLYYFKIEGEQRTYNAFIFAKTLDSAKKKLAGTFEIYEKEAFNRYELRSKAQGIPGFEKNTYRRDQVKNREEIEVFQQDIKTSAISDVWCMRTYWDACNTYVARRDSEDLCHLHVYHVDTQDKNNVFNCKEYAFNNRDALNPQLYRDENQRLHDIVTAYVVPKAKKPKKIQKALDNYLWAAMELQASETDIIALEEGMKALRQEHLQPMEKHCVQGQSIFRMPQYAQATSRLYEILEHLKDQNNPTELMKLSARYNIPMGSPLRPAITEFAVEARKLIAGGSDINAQDANGRTALMYVAVGHKLLQEQLLPGREIFTKLLLELGADFSIQDNKGKTALDYFNRFVGEEHPATIHLKQHISDSAKAKSRERARAKVMSEQRDMKLMAYQRCNLRPRNTTVNYSDALKRRVKP
tara:strand:+ start:75105 stop:76526 length:1422 start_codon:yes stop_codon:yes gene_type:complete